MESKEINLIDLQPKNIELEKTTSKANLTQVFAERRNTYINELMLFVVYFKYIPNLIYEIDIDCRKANQWFTQTYKNEIKDWYFDKRYFNRGKKPEYDDIFYILFEDLIVNFDTNQSQVRFLFRKTEISKVNGIILNITKFRNKTKYNPTISLLINTNLGIETKALLISKPKLSIEENYNDDFKEIHKTIFKRLSKKNDKGLVLLHGKPGTGKTSYIRYLICSLKKEIIFLPPNMANFIINPEFISVLINHPNSVFIIEDAENIVVSRDTDANSPVSALLNISDGLLSDCLNIQIICSFNTDISKIDSALMRKGRLIAKYEFKELEIEKAKRLSRKLGFNSNFNSPMTLTAIYNQGEKDFYQSKRNNTIGFMAQ